MARTKKTVKITPVLRNKQIGVDYANLDDGAWFIHQNCLCIKQMFGDQAGLDISDGDCFEKLCGQFVQPVNVEIKWTKK